MSAAALLLGRTTYEGFAAAWPERTDELGFADKMNSMPKYVVSTTLANPTWNNTTVIGDDVAGSIAKLKKEVEATSSSPEAHSWWSALVQHDLVDEYRLMVFPVILGAGKKLFAEGGELKALTVAESKPAGETVLLTLHRKAE